MSVHLHVWVGSHIYMGVCVCMGACLCALVYTRVSVSVFKCLHGVNAWATWL
jgi:hypothetical protein